jgi:hypothetical protein
MYKLVFSSFLLFAFLSCSPKISKKGGLVEDDNPSLFLKKAVFAPEWMEGKCQLQMASEGSNVSGQGIIRVRKDSAIWVSVRKLGFEVGRALILKDSFFYLDRLNNVFEAHAISFIKEKYQLPGDFLHLQALLFGNAPLDDISDFSVTNKESFEWQLQKSMDNGILSLGWDFNNKRISAIDWGQPASNKYFKMKFGDYKELESKQQFSYFRDLNIQSAETGNLHVVLSFNQVQFNLPVSLRFDVPQRYSGSN